MKRLSIAVLLAGTIFFTGCTSTPEIYQLDGTTVIEDITYKVGGLTTYKLPEGTYRVSPESVDVDTGEAYYQIATTNSEGRRIVDSVLVKVGDIVKIYEDQLIVIDNMFGTMTFEEVR